MKELIINGVTVDLDEKTKMDLQFISFLFTSINSIAAPRSWTVSLPKSAVNMGLINGSSSGDYGGDFPYNNYVVDYYNQSFRLINTGKGILTKISSRIEFVFTFGKAFEKIKLMSETKLTALTETSGDILEWNQSISLNDMSLDFGWCNYYSFTNEDRTLTGTNADIPFGTVHPTVTFDYIMNKIQSFFSITLVGLSALVGGCSFPLRELDGVSTIGSSTLSTGYTPFVQGTQDKYIPFYNNSIQYFDISIDYNSFINVKKIDATVTITTFEAYFDTYLDVDLYLKIKGADGFISNKLATREHLIWLGDETTKYTITNYTFQIKASDEYFFFGLNNEHTFLQSNLSFSTVVNQAYYEPAVTGGYFPIIQNLPDMTCSEFLFQAMQLAGVFPEISDETPDTINFYSADTIVDNIPTAKDWTNKLVKSMKRMSELSDVEFKFGNYAKRNTLAYKKDETNLLNTDDALTIDNENLELESKLVELKFAAGKRFSVSEQTIDYPLYDVKVQSGVLVRNPKSQSNDVLGKITNIGGINYLQFTDDLLWSNIKATDNYVAQQNLLNRPRYLKENFYLKPEDVYNISLQTPIYLQQYGKYYAIMKLQYRESDFSECELLELKNV